ncbi:MAG: beta-galactosidase [Clostridia bacterium]|nr:beta-galactosidase [Clostridia bacterium]
MKKLLFPQFPHFLHGADYNPEQWLSNKEIWDSDMALANEANCNVFSVGIFSWAELEPEDGVYNFSFLDEIIEKIYENGGRVVLATPSAARPKWLADKYPEVLRVNGQGQRMRFGGRHNHCLTSPVYRRKVAEINRRLAARYGKHPAVLCWHISNEYSGECFCPLCQQAFRDFLRECYHNDIDALNHAYWTSFWSHTYRSFEEIEAPMPIGELSVHGLNLDWRRFVSHQTKDFIKAEIAAVREGGSTLPATINMMPGVRDTNYADIAECVDIISWDSYPDWHSPDHLYAACHTAFWHDYWRALKKQPFMLMESAPGLTNWKPINKLKRPGMERLSALQAVAHGADTVQYFQFRKSRGSVEKFHGAVVDHVGTANTRVFAEVQATGRTLRAIEEVLGTMPTPRVALIYDFENRWALTDAQGFVLDGNDKGYLATCVEYYRVFWERGIAVDVVGAHADLTGYSLVVVPQLYMADSDTVTRLSSFVRAGGTLFATYMLGMVNESDLCYLGGFPGGGLGEVLGIWNEEIDTLYPDEVSAVEMDGKRYGGKTYCELIHAQSAEVLATYAADFYQGRPALTRNTYGRGVAYYQAFRDTGDFKERVLDGVISALGIERALDAAALQKGLTAHTRADGEVTYLFLENYAATPTAEIDLGGTWQDMEDGQFYTALTLPAFGIRILKK